MTTSSITETTGRAEHIDALTEPILASIEAEAERHGLTVRCAEIHQGSDCDCLERLATIIGEERQD